MSGPAIIFSAAIVATAIVASPLLQPAFGKLAADAGITTQDASGAKVAPKQDREELLADALMNADLAQMTGRNAVEISILNSSPVPGAPEKVMAYDLVNYDDPVQPHPAGIYMAYCALTDGQVSGTIGFARKSEDYVGTSFNRSVLNDNASLLIAADRFCERVKSSGAFEKVAALPVVGMPDFDTSDDDALKAHGIPVERSERMLHMLNLPAAELPAPVDLTGLSLPFSPQLTPGAPTRILAQFLHGYYGGDTHYYNLCSMSGGQVTGTLVFTPKLKSGAGFSSLDKSARNDEAPLYLAAQKQCERIMAAAPVENAPTSAGAVSETF